MMKKVFLTLSLAGLFGIAAKAQPINPCGSTDVYLRQLALHPEIADREAELNRQIAEKLSKIDLSPYAKTTDGGSTVEYDVPLVFHIIHDYGVEYLPDDSIVSCVKDLNRLYNKMNGDDTLQVITPYKGFIPNSHTRYIGNARITWHLATIDPNGNPTGGITRRRSYITKNGGDLAKYDQWPSSRYMNVWIINKMSAANGNAAAYAYKPPTGDVIPYYDGVIALYSYVNRDHTIGHELGHELNLDHPWGGTNDPGIRCGDDDVDDTPYTKGHPPPAGNGCLVLSAIYDTACLYTHNRAVAKFRIDSVKRADSFLTPLLFRDTSTSKGISFKCRTTSSIDSLTFYPTAAVGSTYIIGIKRNDVLIDTAIVVTDTINAAQRIHRSFVIPAADTSVTYKIFFVQNPGALRDTVTPLLATYSRGLNGSILIQNANDNNYYNFFYNWKISYGYYKIYANDSLVDYPDTTNSQNVMDYTYCSKMFTAGQVERMRAALTSSIAHRDSLISPYNLAATGALATGIALAPKAEFSVEKGITSTGVYAVGEDRSYFLCADGTAATYDFRFQDRSWQAAAASSTWTLSNGATNTTPLAGILKTRFANTGWASISLKATNATGSTEFTDTVYVADPTTVDPVGFFQEFNSSTENARWPIFNYYKNRYKWEVTDQGGYYDKTSIRYRSYDDRTALKDQIVGDASGDYDDFYTPAFDLSSLGTNGNLNFMYAGAYATNNVDLMKDVFEIAYSTTCGGNWTTLKTIQNADIQTVGSVPTSVREYTPSYEDWKAVSVDLKSGTSTIRNPKVFFRFRYKPSSRPVGSFLYASGNNFYIDRINISNNPLSVNEMVLGDKKAAVAPNPTNANAYVLFQKANANVNIEVLDITGKLIYSVSQKVDQNNARVEIPASYLGAKGMYLVHITGEDGLNQTEKLMVY